MFKVILKYGVFIAIMFSSNTVTAQQNIKKVIFEIDPAIIEYRGLEDEMSFLKDSCSWTNAIGKKIDVFWLKREDGTSLFGHSYEYFLGCKNYRFIIWSTEINRIRRIVDFMIEPLESESIFIVTKKKQYKNRKKYSHLLDKNWKEIWNIDH